MNKWAPFFWIFLIFIINRKNRDTNIYNNKINNTYDLTKEINNKIKTKKLLSNFFIILMFSKDSYLENEDNNFILFNNTNKT